MFFAAVFCRRSAHSAMQSVSRTDELAPVTRGRSSSANEASKPIQMISRRQTHVAGGGAANAAVPSQFSPVNGESTVLRYFSCTIYILLPTTIWYYIILYIHTTVRFRFGFVCTHVPFCWCLIFPVGRARTHEPLECVQVARCHVRRFRPTLIVSLRNNNHNNSIYDINM